jgi:hypothetical protein
MCGVWCLMSVSAIWHCIDHKETVLKFNKIDIYTAMADNNGQSSKRVLNVTSLHLKFKKLDKKLYKNKTTTHKKPPNILTLKWESWVVNYVLM